MQRTTSRAAALLAVGALGLSACATGGGETTEGSSSGSGSSSSAAEAYQPKEGGAGGDVGVFTWWAAGSEKKGLDALVAEYKKQYPNDTFVNLAVAGGAGSNAKAKLASDLKNDQPPGSFQGHAGAELTDYIAAGQIEPVNDVVDALGGDEVFPKDLLDRLSVEGSIYSVPSNIHRANVVWANPQVLKKAGINETPKDMKAWIADMEKVKKSGVENPLSIGGTWTQVQLFETVLLSDLGADGYSGLFDGTTKWDSDEVKTAVSDFKTLLSYANTASDGDDWPPATDAVVDGKAAYNVMGDWAVAQFDDRGAKEGEDYTYFPVPGTDGVFDFLADSFTLPRGTENPDGTKDWLMTVGSADGQKAFNLAKGSIPARTDVAMDDFPAYQQSAMEDFTSDTIVSSIAHGAAVPLAWSTDISTAVAKFSSSKDEATLVKELSAAAEKNA
ncbi:MULTISPECIES: extracellular solute-binding protein [Janibacter]|uniref:Extracellular solute-binding protein n=1 Tax=Janibacter melonis TaxID=262209 RepID=A0A176Q9C5_9MICO|nr:extracellular solute-binding protein [Janibacter melonis]MBD5830774.1 extracellular solute-binding protein [Janibacter melonis]MCB5991827.1 extracellular solute-binding protein [Janibacter melonis]MCM3553928.1 extracellular solute-binding protein [Janibacter melonis]OAB86308.1 sugar ABC transporter substrate-binding protein [Janibacter melonis]QFQ30950.2 extracellular solute-binding protein [Janibacter melonis]